MRFLDEKQGKHPFQMHRGERPHIFVFTVDMIPPEFHRTPSPCRQAMRLPAWDSLRGDAVDYRNAFSVSPLCGPSRASLFTGRYPYIFVNEERAHDGTEVALRPDDPIYPEYLKAAGYRLGHVGKSHVGTETFSRVFGESCSPWNRWAPPVYDDPEYHMYLADRGIDGFQFRREIRGTKPDGVTPGNSYGGWLEQRDGAAFPMAGTYPHYLVHRALGVLDSLRRQGEGTPLYLHVDLFAPHQPFFIPAGLEKREQQLRAAVPLPDGYTRWQAGRAHARPNEPRIYGTYERNWGLDDPAVAREYQIANMLQMEVIDAALARFLARLKELGLYENSIVLLAADHGEMNLERGLVDKGAYCHPKAARTPLLLKLPGNARAGTTVDDDVCLLDIAPTLLTLVGVEPCARLDGIDLLSLLDEDHPDRETPFVFEAGWHVAPNPAVAIHGRFPQGHFRYAYNAADRHDELYNLDDPEYRNRIDDASVAQVRIALRRQLQQIFEGDPRWRCYRQAFELDRAADLPAKTGDNQMFIPE
jgi:arylsulfatase A-like enzyme